MIASDVGAQDLQPVLLLHLSFTDVFKVKTKFYNSIKLSMVVFRKVSEHIRLFQSL